MKAFKFLKFALVFYFLAPYLIFFQFSKLSPSLDLQELLFSFKNSFIQSFLAAVLVTVLSIPFSLALFQISGRLYDVVMKLLLLPQILPSFFSILIAFSIWKPFPFGTTGISFIFTIVHLGFAVVLLHTATREKMGSYATVSEVFGFSRFQFFRKIYFPILKNDLLSVLLMIFIFCFASFAIPLVAGGGKDTNVEMLIFEKVFINQNWSAAWSLSVLQSLFLTGISFLLIRKQNTDVPDFTPSSYLTSWPGYVGVVIYLFIFLTGYLLGLFQSLPDFSKISLFYTDMLSAAATSLSLFAVYAVITFILLYLWLYDFVRNHKLTFASHLIAASTMLVGFSFYLYFPQTAQWDFFKIPVATSILVFPVLFKSFLEKSIVDLKDQVVTAQIFGISTNRIIIDVLLRRIRQPLQIWFSFLSIWFLCDFAVTKALGTQQQTLGLMAQSFLSSYRLSLAYLMSIYILLVWVFTLGLAFFLREVLSVTYKKFKFKF